ncbi:MAG TPA: DUF2203 domain-containing protein [Bryobacteraceae bacterium]|nr:DUF2203 domain-containing protein [Bryobacteraceae bacterium]
MARRFTLQEAESLLPEIEGELREAISLKSEFEAAEGAVQSITQRVIMLGGVLIDREEVQRQTERRDRAAAGLKAAIEKIQESGCIIKDLDIGLVDFTTLFRGEEVYLCWKLGEPGIRFWHGMNEGFAGRKPIDEEFRALHRGDAAN